MRDKLLTVLFMMCHLCGHGFEAQLSFQDLGETGAPVLPLSPNNDISDGPITVSGGGIPYLVTEIATDLYISDNGLISLNGEFVDPPQQGSDFSAADGEGVIIIAPYWSDNDIRLSGAVRYVEYTSTHQIPAVRAKLAEVSELLSDATGSVFSGVWMFLAEWSNCSSFQAGSDPPQNKYQAIVVTDSVSQSYAIFIYVCNEIEWSGSNSTYARVGLSNGMGRSYIHPSSGNESIVNIDCSNLQSTIVNVGLDLNTFAPFLQIPPSAINSSVILSSMSDSVSPSNMVVLSTPSQMQTVTPTVSVLVSPSVIAVVSTPSASDSVGPSMAAAVSTPLQMQTPTVSIIVSFSMFAVVSTPSEASTPSTSDPSIIAVVSTPSQTITPTLSISVSLSLIAVVPTPSQASTPSASDSVSPSATAVVSTPSQTPTPLALNPVSPSMTTVVSTPSVSDSVSPSVIVAVSTPSQTQTPTMSISVSPSVIGVVSTPSQTLAQFSSSSTTSMATPQANQATTNTVSAFPSPSNMQNDTTRIVNIHVPVHVIAVPVVVLLLILITSLIIIFLCFYIYLKSLKKTAKVEPAGETDCGYNYS